MLNDATPSFRELLLNRLTPPDDRDHVRVIVRLKQRETLTVVESAIKVDGLDPGVKAVEDTEELSEDTTCGIAVFETAYRQRLAFVLHTRVEWHRRGTQWFHASLPSDRGRLCRLRHRSRAAGGGLRRPPPVRGTIHRILSQGVLATRSSRSGSNFVRRW